MILAGVVVVALGAVTVIAGFALAERDGPTNDAGPAPTSASPTPTGDPAQPGQTPDGPATSEPAPPPGPGAPPTNVRVVDNRDSVTLTWTYPTGAEGPVVVSGGRSGQEPRAFQELPAGTGSYVVYGLNGSQDYCFVVAVIYSTDLIGRADPVCTDRG